MTQFTGYGEAVRIAARDLYEIEVVSEATVRAGQNAAPGVAAQRWVYCPLARPREARSCPDGPGLDVIDLPRSSAAFFLRDLSLLQFASGSDRRSPHRNSDRRDGPESRHIGAGDGGLVRPMRPPLHRGEIPARLRPHPGMAETIRCRRRACDPGGPCEAARGATTPNRRPGSASATGAWPAGWNWPAHTSCRSNSIPAISRERGDPARPCRSTDCERGTSLRS